MTVSVPAHPRHARVLRIVACAGGARTGLGIERLDEVGLAVDEAASALLTAGSRSTLTCVFHDVPGGSRIELSGDPSDDVTWPPDHWDDSIGAMVLEGVATGVLLGHTADGAPSIEFTVTA
jgi:hypothetical protein